MSSRKKLQVFVSSTYEDLKEERQAAVEAILRSGHIPAGMELFAAGDKSQMEVIRKWIEESDAYLLILGGRYGSLDEAANKSYTQLEYEYAVSLNKPHFAVVLRDEWIETKLKQVGRSAIETKHATLYEEFKKLVLSKIVRKCSDLNEIKLSVMETLMSYTDRKELTGWIPGSEAVDTGQLAEEIARLAKENAELRSEIHALQSLPPKSSAGPVFNGLEFDDILHLLESQQVEFQGSSPPDLALQQYSEYWGQLPPRLVDWLWVNQQIYSRGMEDTFHPNASLYSNILRRMGLVESEFMGYSKDETSPTFSFTLTQDGDRFLLKYEVVMNHNVPNMKSFVISR